jgi:hypothetical protein
MKTELEKLRGSSGEAEKSSNKVTELLAQIKTLKLELEKEVIALILRNIVPSSMSYWTSLRVQYDILGGTIFLNISAITLL